MAKDKTGSIITHIDSSHAKGNIFEKEANTKPKVNEGCYANAEGRNSSDQKERNSKI